jgi:hypothetical protein
LAGTRQAQKTAKDNRIIAGKTSHFRFILEFQEPAGFMEIRQDAALPSMRTGQVDIQVELRN